MWRSRGLLCNFSPAISVELASINRMGSASLREAAESLIKESNMDIRKKFATAICDRSLEISKDMKHWDMIAILQAISRESEFTSPTPLSDDDHYRMDELAKFFISRLSVFSPKHLIDTLAAFESIGYRSRNLYVELLNRVIQQANSTMYIDEYIALLRVVARHKILNDDLLTSLSRSILSNPSLLDQMRFLHCCEVAGCLGHIQFLPRTVKEKLKEKCKLEMEVMSVEEIWKSTTGLKTKLSFSYKPLEDMIWCRLREMIGGERLSIPNLLDQVSSPMDFIQFLRMNEMLTDEILIGACKWANGAVYRPATRMNVSKRPTVFEVALLADLCVQRQVPVETIAKAVKITVASEGGATLRVSKPKPLQYRRRRAYLRLADPYVEKKIVPVKDYKKEEITKVMKSNEAAFAPKLRSLANTPLWKSRSNAWYFRK